ncbi:MAG: N-acetyl-gamma-glutamyl-phosphate reductase [Ilumatobacteraceae bacterium]|nr:N-acetyl-gamma-glutamyl-phosphate reductase [Ilumatobacteraceae bacterium]
MHDLPTLRAAIVGASGFTGAELLRLLAQHPHLDVVALQGDTSAGSRLADLHPGLATAMGDRTIGPVDVDALDGIDVVFLGLPHEASLELAPALVDRVRCVVDLSAAFRLRDASQYPRYYGFEHDQPGLLAEAVYGLPERYRTALREARLVATPGCYVTAATLAVEPLVSAGLIDPTAVIVDAASGVSGAGRAATPTTAFCTVDENLTAYGLLDHRHTPEMEQETGATVLFTPHLAPMNRGILATCYGRPLGAATTDDALAVLRDRYAGETFVAVTDGIPGTKATLGSNTAILTARVDQRTGHVIAIAALDNLCKGASGGALQSANVALGLPEAAGLPRVGVAP